jgi:hypothetical protein
MPKPDPNADPKPSTRRAERIKSSKIGNTGGLYGRIRRDKDDDPNSRSKEAGTNAQDDGFQESVDTFTGGSEGVSMARASMEEANRRKGSVEDFLDAAIAAGTDVGPG